MPLTAYLDSLPPGALVATPLAAEAMPSGPMHGELFESLAGSILKAVTRSTDIVLLDLHGAMVTDNHQDPDGELIRRIRQKAPKSFIGVTCDFHANITQEMVRHGDIIAGYKTYPHIDKFDIGKLVAAATRGAALRGERLNRAWGQSRVRADTLRMGTDDEPMKRIMSRARDLEASPGVTSVSVFGGFPLADVPEATMSVVVTGRGRVTLLEAIRNELLELIFSCKEQLVYQGVDLATSLEKAKASTRHPTVLVDHADNCGSGGTQDVMTVVSASRNAGLNNMLVVAICDPAVVQRLEKAGIGKEISCLLYTSPSPRDLSTSRMPSSA